MKIHPLLYCTAAIIAIYFIFITGTGCAQIGSPTGGPRDSIPPELVSAIPKLLNTNFKGNKIILNFNEYVDVQDVQNNLLVSPLPKINPTIDFKFKIVTIKLKDSLLDNTTYTINFGNAIRDNNEGNPFKNFSYVFSTGKTIDSLQIRGSVIVAQTGKPDSTIIALLYQQADDSAVQKRKPNYIAKLDSSGNFTFKYLAAGEYKIYALKDGDGGKTYSSKIETFAFADSIVAAAENFSPIKLYAYEEEKEEKKVPRTTAAGGKNAALLDKKLKYTSSLTNNEQDLLSDLLLTVNHPLKMLDAKKLILTDTNFNTIATKISIDSTQKIISIQTKWKEGTQYRLLLFKEAFSDSIGTQLAKQDTIRFVTKQETAYGNLIIRFSNLATVVHPILQFIKEGEIYKSIPITSPQWSDKLFRPGEYELRVLFDDNNNGKWDPGSYSKKIQPEKAMTLDTKLVIKANWDNEREIKF
jgi:Bacterial Ig-like domain